ncbi:hypothetical protein FB45DRAFT_1064251 [Roridomyces roridus]|uniref:MYND-type domain-containing protein n=1 Tax=Roridomyces roridus TaxID=1738132 RepID=A0AAD7BBK8_9AGAR|nr:hypothetical protein FB45DRAFT_1064251 [Roridomyces roridus]
MNPHRGNELLLKVRATPVRYIATARNQTPRGLEVLDALGRVWTEIPQIMELGALEMFLSHVREAVAPTSPREWQLDADFAYSSLSALSASGMWKLLEHANNLPAINCIVLDGLPGIIKWSQYIYDLTEAPRFYMLILVFRVLSSMPQVAAAMVEAPGCVQLITKLWALEDIPKNLADTVPTTATAILVALLTYSVTSGKIDDFLQRFIEASGGDAQFLMRFILRRIKKATRKLEIDAELASLSEHINLVIGLCAQNPHRLCRALLDEGGLVVMTSTLGALPNPVGRDVSGSAIIKLFVACIIFFSSLISVSDYLSILRAVKAGFMDAFIEACPAFLRLERGLTDVAMAIVRDLLPPYCLYRSFAMQMIPFVERFKSSPVYAGLRELPIIKAAFAPLFTALNRRLPALQDEGHGRRCLNCQRVDVQKMFKQCTACQVAYYCSTECQRSEWKSSHRQLCRDLSLCNQLGGSGTKRDWNSMRFFAEWTADCNFETFRAIAERDFPDTPREELVPHIDFSCVPEAYSVLSVKDPKIQNLVDNPIFRARSECGPIVGYTRKNGAEAEDMWGCARRENFWND